MTAITHFNVFHDPYDTDPHPIFNGVRSSVRPLHRSADGRVFVTSRKYPDGAEYDADPTLGSDEVFYIVEGTVWCEPADGEPMVFHKGELIFYPAGVPAHWRYSPGSQHLAVFWGDEPVGATAPGPE